MTDKLLSKEQREEMRKNHDEHLLRMKTCGTSQPPDYALIALLDSHQAADALLADALAVMKVVSTEDRGECAYCHEWYVDFAHAGDCRLASLIKRLEER